MTTEGGPASAARAAPIDWALRRRLARVLIAAGAVVILLIVASIVLLIQLRSHQHQVINRYFTAVNISNDRFIDEIDAETATRGYALTGDPTTLQPFRTAESAEFATQLDRMTQLVGDDRAAQASLRAWTSAYDAWTQDVARPLLAQVRRHGGDSVTATQVLNGKARFDANRAAFSRFSNVLVAKRNAASNALQLRTTLLFVAVLVATLGIALSGVGLWLALRRWVLTPLTALGNETRLVSSGSFEHPVAVGGPREIVSLAGDVEDMRREIVLQLAAVERGRAVIEQARLDLEAQAEDLARSNRDLEQFAYVASHDLQEPLRKVASFCQMLERRYAGQLDARADQYIAFAVDGAKRMQQLINDLLAFSRVGRSPDTMTDVDLQACLDSAMLNLAASIAATNAVVTSDPLPRVHGERGLLVQLLQNLIGNAIKFHGDIPPVVHIGATRRDDEWEFACSDNGIGIEPQYAERIFVIFQRLHGKEEFTGTGIGLALCKRIVEHHGGQIWLDTETPVGTTFRWTIPTSAATSATLGTTVRDEETR
jgi:signal transduction histidine kinase